MIERDVLIEDHDEMLDLRGWSWRAGAPGGELHGTREDGYDDAQGEGNFESSERTDSTLPGTTPITRCCAKTALAGEVHRCQGARRTTTVEPR